MSDIHPPAAPEIEAKAIALCKANCRALACELDGFCHGSRAWGGPGATWFSDYVRAVLDANEYRDRKEGKAMVDQQGYLEALKTVADHQREQESKLTKSLRRAYPTPEKMAGFMAPRDQEWIGAALNLMRTWSHGSSVANGWHDGVKKEPGTMLALIHSEISEALEGVRKDLMDEHLPERKMVEVELADALHRIMDFAGKYDLDIGGAYIEKGFYNLRREDHKPENRVKPGGKTF